MFFFFRWASVLLKELMQQKSDVAEKEDLPLVRSLIHVHAFVTLFLTMPRANQVSFFDVNSILYFDSFF